MTDNVIPFPQRQSPAFQAKVASRDAVARLRDIMIGTPGFTPGGKPTLTEEASKARMFNPKGEYLPVWKPR